MGSGSEGSKGRCCILDDKTREQKKICDGINMFRDCQEILYLAELKQ